MMSAGTPVSQVMTVIADAIAAAGLTPTIATAHDNKDAMLRTTALPQNARNEHRVTGTSYDL